jgi:hypothetical protein
MQSNFSGSGQGAYDSGAAGVNGNGADQANNSATQATNQANHHLHLGRFENGLAKAFNNDISSIHNYVDPLMSSNNPQSQAQAQQYLQQSVNPSSDYADSYKSLGVNTNQDVLDKAPDYVQNLNSAADAHMQNAATYNTWATQATAAANQMQNYKQTLDQQGQNIQSIAGQSTNIANKNAGNGTDNTSSASGNVGSNLASGLGQSSQDPNASNGDQTASNAAAAGAAGNQGTASDSAEKSPPGSQTGGGRQPASLADRLRAALADQSTDGTNAKKQPTSEFDSVFEDLSNKKESDSSATVNAKEPQGEVGTSSTRFSMLGSETERAVKSLLSPLQGSNEGRETFGNIDQTVFVRMSKYLTKAQINKMILSR